MMTTTLTTPKMKRITCLQCDTPKQDDVIFIDESTNCWWLCDLCESEVEEKLNCINHDVNFNL